MAIDRRVLRTRTALYDALVRLIRRKPYGEHDDGQQDTPWGILAIPCLRLRCSFAVHTRCP